MAERNRSCDQSAHEGTGLRRNFALAILRMVCDALAEKVACVLDAVAVMVGQVFLREERWLVVDGGSMRPLLVTAGPEYGNRQRVGRVRRRLASPPLRPRHG